MRNKLGHALFLIGVLSNTGNAVASVSIAAPNENEILYGPTRIHVVVGGDAARVDVYLDRYESPICSFTEPPYECEFDAGTRLDSRILQAIAFDAEGFGLGRDAIVTYSFVDADSVVATTLTVPLVASRDGDGAPPDLGGVEWSCEYGGEPWEVIEARKLGDNVNGMVGDGIMRHARNPMSDRPPVSLEVLIDVSPSVWSDRSDIEDALRYVIDNSPTPVEISISEFAGDYRKLVQFTSSKSKLRRGLRDLSERQPWTCVLAAVRRSLSELHARPGHKALFLISDTQETCEARGGYRPATQHQESTGISEVDEAFDLAEPEGNWTAQPMRANRKAITETLELSRQVGIPIYVYRVGGDAVTSINAIAAFQQMTEESGGLWMSSGDLSSLTEALAAVLGDLESTWMLDVALPAFAVNDHEADLSLGVDAQDPVALRYPARWRGGNRASLLLVLLQLGDAEARGWSAEQLRNSRDAEVLKELLAAYRREGSAANRIEQMTSIYHVSAYLLLHGDEQGQRAALGTLSELSEIDPVLIRRLRPALRAYLKMEAPRKLRNKAERLLTQPAYRLPRSRPDPRG